jgi:release factor glutamine methyltransferase
MTGFVIARLLEDAARRLAATGIEAPLREARLLLGHAADLPAATIMAWPERAVAAEAAERFGQCVARRLDREPISRILGRREFWSLDFRVTPATLDPRPDTETLIEAVLRRTPDPSAPRRLLDLGTGTGCILLALLSELPSATGIGIDRSEAAARVAAANAGALGLGARAEIMVGDWTEALGSGGFDIVLSNPPYIPSAEIPALDPEVSRHDPLLALDGGADGLDAYRRLLPEIGRLLKPGGLAAVEIGQGQADAVALLHEKAGLVSIERATDLGGIERVVTARAADTEKTK